MYDMWWTQFKVLCNWEHLLWNHNHEYCGVRARMPVCLYTAYMSVFGCTYVHTYVCTYLYTYVRIGHVFMCAYMYKSTYA